MDNLPGSFDGELYINLETYRQDGTPVRTPVWFVQDGRRLYVRTGAASGKVRRIRANPSVKVVASEVHGLAKSRWIPASARVLGPDALQRYLPLFAEKYHLDANTFERDSRLSQMDTVIIELELAPSDL